MDRDLATYVGTARALLAAFRDIPETRTTRPLGPFHDQADPTAVSLATHAHYLASPALDLIEEGRSLAAIPLARTAYECALTAQWIARVPHAHASLAKEHRRQQEAFARTAEAAGHPEVSMAGGSMLMHASGEPAGARGFEAVLRDFHPDGAHGAYLVYRRLSELSHATVEVADAYVAGDLGRNGPYLSAFPDEWSPILPAQAVAAALVWAGRVVDDLVEGHPRRAELEEAGARVGAAPSIPLRD